MLEQITNPITFAELFSGIGLMRLGLEQTGMQCQFANDIDANKNLIYQHHFGSSHLHAGDIAELSASQIPSTDLITASFPCQDLSLAGNRQGLAGERSGLFHEFIRILTELAQEHRAPRIVLLEKRQWFADLTQRARHSQHPRVLEQPGLCLRSVVA